MCNDATKGNASNYGRFVFNPEANEISSVGGDRQGPRLDFGLSPPLTHGFIDPSPLRTRCEASHAID
jgi:hypothetical protein